jgi:nucleoside-diphosphate-sugar epimerase
MGSTSQPALPQRVFITGANGFIGRALAQRYRSLGAEVRGIDFKADPAWNVVAGDVRQRRLGAINWPAPNSSFTRPRWSR